MAGVRLNNIIRVLEAGKHAVSAFAPPTIENAISVGTARYDGVVFESEHQPYDINGLRHCLQYMLDRNQILAGGSLAPAVTPMVRIPVNGSEMSQWLAKQVLDIGFYGIVWPHVSTAEEAYNAVAACRYPRPKEAENFEPEGQRGDAPRIAMRYWGLSQQEYYKKADVWPLNPEGEILCMIMCEEVKAIDNLPDILKRVPGIGVVLIGEGDLSQNLGHPRDYDHPVVVEAMATIRAICKENNVPVGHPHVGLDNVKKVVEDGYRYLIVGAEQSYQGVDKALELTGRA